MFGLVVTGGGSLIHLVVIAIIVCAVIAIAWIAFRAMGISPPPWAVQIFWIVVIAIVAILAINLIVSAW